MKVGVFLAGTSINKLPTNIMSFYPKTVAISALLMNHENPGWFPNPLPSIIFRSDSVVLEKENTEKKEWSKRERNILRKFHSKCELWTRQEVMDDVNIQTAHAFNYREKAGFRIWETWNGKDLDFSRSSAYPMIELAYLLGANEIFVFGLDGYQPETGETHFYGRKDCWKSVFNDKNLRTQLDEDLKKLNKNLLEVGCCTWNMNPSTLFKAFPCK